MIRIPPGTATAVRAAVGQRLRVVNLEGHQVADLIAFNADDLTETLSPAHTIVSLGRLVPTAGDELRTNRRRPILKIARDDTGRHDLLIPACDPWRYEYDYGVMGHRNCSDSFLEALRPWSVQRHQLPQPVNLFQNMDYASGSVTFRESLAKAGDVVELAALMNVVAAVSACPMDLNPISGYRLSDIGLEIL